jgi:hypothetical protein
MMPYDLVGGYQHSGGTYCLHFQGVHTYAVSIFRVEALKMETVYFSEILPSTDESTWRQTREENQHTKGI